jgi:hypothetical protein
MAQMLIDESKEPQGYFVAETCLDVVGHNIAVGKVGNLLEALPFATNLESVRIISLRRKKFFKKVSFQGKFL